MLLLNHWISSNSSLKQLDLLLGVEHVSLVIQMASSVLLKKENSTLFARELKKLSRSVPLNNNCSM